MDWAVIILSGGASVASMLLIWRKRPPRMHAALPLPRLDAELPPATRAARRTTLRDAKVGEYVAVIGRIAAPAELVAPVSGRACVASDLVVVGSLTGDHLVRLIRGDAFTLEDTTGQAVVDARGAYLRVGLDHVVENLERAQLDDPTPLAAIPDATLLTAHEGVLAVGARVLVIGVVQPADDIPDAAYRRAADRRVRLAGGGPRPALISDRPDDLAAFDA